MAQRKGIYNILSNSLIYEFLQFIFSHKKTKEAWDILIKDHEKKLSQMQDADQVKRLWTLKIQKNIQELIHHKNISIMPIKKYSIFGDFYCLSVDSINKGPLKDISNIDLVILK